MRTWLTFFINAHSGFDRPQRSLMKDDLPESLPLVSTKRLVAVLGRMNSIKFGFIECTVGIESKTGSKTYGLTFLMSAIQVLA